MSVLDVAVSGVSSLIGKESKIVLKFKELIIEVQRALNIKTELLPVIIGAT